MQPSYLEYKGKYKGIFAWIFSTDHKRSASCTFIQSWDSLLLGPLLGTDDETGAFAPGKTIMGPQAYNGFFTLHGIIMIFLIVIPGLPAVFGNFFLPLMIGAKDVAFPGLILLPGGFTCWER
jgi:cytochrome c oxidase subunit I